MLVYLLVGKTSRAANGLFMAEATPARILDIAEQLAQRRGFNGFSYADIAEQMLVTKASLHYHFRSKADLGRALLERYRTDFEKALAEIDSSGRTPGEQLRRYVKLYANVLVDDRMCLCGMFAAEYSTLPDAMQDELREFFDLNERWLTGVLDKGCRDRSMKFRESAKARARVLLGGLEGAMLVARTYGEPSRFRSIADSLLADLLGPARRK